MAANEMDEARHLCSRTKQQLIDCLRASDCVRKLNMTPRECIKWTSPGVDEDCRAVQKSFFECKRSLIDMRTRFRGSKWT
ncbi:cytochrome c oxidase assembly factor 5-like [Corticium candelabrum]|uniref:cytochrome c oxidase assembly factor 5-like n=1 Tax=Corticium candelabrum TaxID=121492 RepID=UPI002E268A3B|nr:cytochrome c oxidase assembly factor 5-like [Corticium candelabrum]